MQTESSLSIPLTPRGWPSKWLAASPSQKRVQR